MWGIGQPFADVMQRKNFLFCGPSLETRRETVEFPFELLPPSRRKEAKSEGDVNTPEKSEEDGDDEKESESEDSSSKERRHLVYISMGTLYRMNPLFFRVRRFRSFPLAFAFALGLDHFPEPTVVVINKADVLRRVQEQPAPVCHVCGQGQPWYVNQPHTSHTRHSVTLTHQTAQRMWERRRTTSL
jgi:hypothetical protein